MVNSSIYNIKWDVDIDDAISTAFNIPLDEVADFFGMSAGYLWDVDDNEFEEICRKYFTEHPDAVCEMMGLPDTIEPIPEQVLNRLIDTARYYGVKNESFNMAADWYFKDYLYDRYKRRVTSLDFNLG